MAVLSITRGIPGSGKSTAAKRVQALGNSMGFQHIIVERDEIRMELTGSYAPGDWEFEKKVTEIQHERIRTLLEAGVHVICSDTNLRSGPPEDCT